MGALEGKTTAFRMNDRRSNLGFARVALGYLVREGGGCKLLDLDAFYSSNLETIAAGLTPEGFAKVEIIIPEPGSEPEAALASLFSGAEAKPILIDSINSLYQLLSVRNPRSAGRKFTFFISTLAAWAKSNGKPVIASIYDRRPTTTKTTSKTLTDRFDVSISTSAGAGGLTLMCERGSTWRGGCFFLPFEDRKVEAHED